MPDARDAICEVIDEASLDVQAIYLFGSRGRNDAAPNSDWDVALLCRERLDPVFRWELQEKLATRLGANVDLVELRAASTVLKVQVLKDGVVLLDRDPAARAEFEMYALSGYMRLQEERKAILEDARHRGWLYE